MEVAERLGYRNSRGKGMILAALLKDVLRVRILVIILLLRYCFHNAIIACYDDLFDGADLGC